MNTYESIFIARPSLSDEAISHLMGKIKDMIDQKGGVVLKTENWGKKKLAYQVERERRGTFLLFHLKGDGALVKELEHFSRVEDGLIRLLTVKAVFTEGQKDKAVPAPHLPSEDKRNKTVE